jgi:hypothetical protein
MRLVSIAATVFVLGPVVLLLLMYLMASIPITPYRPQIQTQRVDQPTPSLPKPNRPAGVTFAATGPGSPEVYKRIAAMTDCAAIQQERDTADANAKRDRERGRPDLAEIAASYRSAAEVRMEDFGCNRGR